MSNYREILASALWRSLPAVAIGAMGWWLLATATGGLGAIPRLLSGMFCLLIAAIIMAPSIARLMAEPSGSLFWPGRRFDRPQPMYGIPQSKRAKGLYEEAMAGFEQIAQDHPDEVKPYIEMIDLAIVNLKDPDRANAIYQRGMSLLQKDEDKAVLAKMYSAIRTRLNAIPSN
jgi:hypothetical protein